MKPCKLTHKVNFIFSAIYSTDDNDGMDYFCDLSVILMLIYLYLYLCYAIMN